MPIIQFLVVSSSSAFALSPMAGAIGSLLLTFRDYSQSEFMFIKTFGSIGVLELA
jgi:hypothetical protein